MNLTLRSSVVLVHLVLATAGMGAPPSDMSSVIEEFEADLHSVSGFYDLSWSVSRLNRLDRLEHDWQGRLERIDFDRQIGRASCRERVLHAV